LWLKLAAGTDAGRPLRLNGHFTERLRSPALFGKAHPFINLEPSGCLVLAPALRAR
jgi:hypothetical protein